MYMYRITRSTFMRGVTALEPFLDLPRLAQVNEYCNIRISIRK